MRRSGERDDESAKVALEGRSGRGEGRSVRCVGARRDGRRGTLGGCEGERRREKREVECPERVDGGERVRERLEALPGAQDEELGTGRRDEDARDDAEALVFRGPSVSIDIAFP